MKEPGLPEIAWAKDMSGLDDGEIRARLRSLPAERQVNLFLNLDWKDRLRVIEHSDLAGELVRALPEEEVFLTVKGAGEEDALPLIALSTPKQLRFILDIELWTRETVDEAKARLWMGYLLSCGEAKIVELVETLDRELILILLSKLITLVPNEEGVRIPEGLPGIMPDEYFTILSNIPEETETVRLVLRVLRQWNRDEFYKLLFEVHGSLGAETEETAFRWRSSRLAEKGLLEFDEAVEVYGYITEEEAEEIARAASDVLHASGEGGLIAPAYPVLLAQGRTLFYEVLTSIEDASVRSRLRSEIAFCANRLLIADAQKIGEIDSIKAALERLFSLANVGLLHLTGGNRQEAVAAVQRIPVRDLFQNGFSRAADLRRTARDIARRWWPTWQEDGFIFLDYREDGVMRGLMLRVPQYFALPSRETKEFRDFTTMQEVAETRRIIDTIAVVAETCFDRLGIPSPQHAKPVMSEVLARGIEEIDLRNLCLTGFVNFILKGEFAITPLPRRSVKDLFEKVLEKRASGERLVKAENMERFLSWLHRKTGYDGKRWEILCEFLRCGIGALEQEVGGIRSWQDLSPRYVRSLVFGGRPGKMKGEMDE